MVYNQALRSRRVLIIIAIVTALISFNGFLSKSSSSTGGNSPKRSGFQPAAMSNRKVKEKIMDINDRQPSYKLYIYEGYDVTNSRYRAQAKLVDRLKLHDKCQQNPGTIVVDVGASLGSISIARRVFILQRSFI